MKPIDAITGTMVPLLRSNIDTDQIMPKQFLKRVERTGYGEFLFYDWRRDEDDFVLERPEYREAKILVAGPNFGSGSSREHAPWGLQDWGFEAIVAPSFADIFRNNCTKIGLLPVELTEKEVVALAELAEHEPDAEVTIDLPTQLVTHEPDFEAGFHIDPYTKWRLTEGLDDIGITLRHEDLITDFETERPAHKPALS
ncbi:MAG: 3-isopropylmalate dehydratase small subunit [Acidimicrobiia bacterium]|nr:3-isopropylmalate dehydratase small subunit [Acidimicrobiia bacterium]